MIKIESLKQFDEEIERIRREFNSHSVLLYRGQADSSWKIESSLERIGKEEISCKEYYRYIDKLKPLINPFIKNKFTRKTTQLGYPFKFDEYDEGLWALPEMDYLTYLRHHGFPTPIIDWTESHYIALFFACEDFVNSKTDGKVFVYNEIIHGRLSGTDIPQLRKIGKYVETDKRHFAQQSQYLFPVMFEGEWKLITFKRVIENIANRYDFVEIEVANEAKTAIIKELRRMNINRYTMYLDEDSLIRNFADEFSLANNK